MILLRRFLVASRLGLGENYCEKGIRSGQQWIAGCAHVKISRITNLYNEKKPLKEEKR